MDQNLVDVSVPQAGTETEASVSEIIVGVGDQVEEGQSLLVLEMDKVEVDVESPTGGVIKELLVSVGEEVELGQVLIRIATSE